MYGCGSVLTLSIPHFRIRVGRRSRRRRSRLHFQFLILGYEASEDSVKRVIANFQFLILGYSIMWYFARSIEDFQFLILGYIMKTTWYTAVSIMLSIPHFRIRATANTCLPPALKLSIPHFRIRCKRRRWCRWRNNFQFLILGYTRRAYEDYCHTIFQFLILGYRQIDHDYSELRECFQFLILGYQDTGLGESDTRTFNSSF